MAAAAAVKIPEDHVEVQFPLQHKHFMPKTVYILPFGQLHGLRKNATVPTPVPEGARKDEYLKFEKAADSVVRPAPAKIEKKKGTIDERSHLGPKK